MTGQRRRRRWLRARWRLREGGGRGRVWRVEPDCYRGPRLVVCSNLHHHHRHHHGRGPGASPRQVRRVRVRVWVRGRRSASERGCA